MQGLLLIAHGSRLAVANQQVESLVPVLRARYGNTYAWIGSAFLELAAPSIEQGLQQAVDAGVVHVHVLPFFLTDGRHNARDIPRIVTAFEQQNPTVEISVGQSLVHHAALLHVFDEALL